MIKFIRKYQMIILVVGGTLLMIVFLLQPILTRLSPSPDKAKVAKLADGTSFSRGDISRAKATISLLGNTYPRALQPLSAGGLGLSSSDETDAALHWLMLVDAARKAGLVGEAGDGQSWIPQIAETEALIQAQNEAQRGMITDAQAFNQRVSDLKAQFINIITQRAGSTAAGMRGTMDEAYRILAEARGVYRLINGLDYVPAYSEYDAIEISKEDFDAVAANAVLIPSSLVAGAIEEPSEEQLQQFFEVYKGQDPKDNEYGIGYLQPARIQLGWIALNKKAFEDAVKVDRIELNKIWQKNRDTYPGDFAGEKAALEKKYREDQAASMMVEADRLIRAQVLAKINAFPKHNGVVELPDDWAQQAPKLDEIAQSVTDRINQQFGTTMPTIEVNMIGDRWLSPQDIIGLPGIGFSMYVIGSRQIPTYLLPQFFEPEAPDNLGLDVQPMLPIVDHAAVDQQGNRYYAMVLGVRDAGPASDIADAGRDRVLNDYKSLKGYELLVARAAELTQLVKQNDAIAPALDQVMAMANDPNAPRPGVLRQILVRKGSIDKGALARTVPPQLNNEIFRDAVIDAAKGLNPLIDPAQLRKDPIAVEASMPKSRSIALALVLAPRPLTDGQFRVKATQAVRQARGNELREAGFFERSPYSFEVMSEREGLVKLKDIDEDM